MAAVAITRTELDAAGLRRAASRSRDADAARRLLVLALEGQNRMDAARACGMDRQTLRDWVHRYNEAGLAGLGDKRGRTGPKRRLSPEQEARVAEWVRQGPGLATHGVVRWRRAGLARAIAAEFGVTVAERSVGDLLRRLGFRRLSMRPWRKRLRRFAGTPGTTPRRRRLSGHVQRPAQIAFGRFRCDRGPATDGGGQAGRGLVAGRSTCWPARRNGVAVCGWAR